MAPGRKLKMKSIRDKSLQSIINHTTKDASCNSTPRRSIRQLLDKTNVANNGMTEALVTSGLHNGSSGRGKTNTTNNTNENENMQQNSKFHQVKAQKFSHIQRTHKSRLMKRMIYQLESWSNVFLGPPKILNSKSQCMCSQRRTVVSSARALARVPPKAVVSSPGTNETRSEENPRLVFSPSPLSTWINIKASPRSLIVSHDVVTILGVSLKMTEVNIATQNANDTTLHEVKGDKVGNSNEVVVDNGDEDEFDQEFEVALVFFFHESGLELSLWINRPWFAAKRHQKNCIDNYSTKQNQKFQRVFRWNFNFSLVVKGLNEGLNDQGVTREGIEIGETSLEGLNDKTFEQLGAFGHVWCSKALDGWQLNNQWKSGKPVDKWEWREGTRMERSMDREWEKGATKKTKNREKIFTLVCVCVCRFLKNDKD
ncbi:hypothetical protein DH2020_024783 [Rehmannia glutinosa]|uniref:Uncharacterized protein n=1 Tax=Rehmannia glutinosa TaxID=99300 RepID=A0ABR0W2B6_REHGL